MSEQVAGGWARLVDRLRPGIILYDHAGRVVECNPSAARLLGITRDEPRGWPAVRDDGTPWPSDTHPTSEVLRTGEPVIGASMGVTRPDGSQVWLRVHSERYVDGVTSGVLTTLVDITDAHDEMDRRRHLEAVLRRNESLARHTLDALDQGVVLADLTGQIRLINLAAERILGYTAQELTALWRSGEWTTFDVDGVLLPPEQRPMYRAAVTRRPVIGELVRWRRRDGGELVLRLTIVPEADGADSLVVAFTDVTAEHHSRRMLERYQHLFRHANDIIAVIDETGQVMYTSPSTVRVLGYAAGHEEPGGILALVHPEDLSAAAAELRLLMDGKRNVEVPFTVRIRDAAGDWRHVECVGTNLLHVPAVRGVVLTARDATERVRLTEQLEHRATHDTLTDLANRRTLEVRLEGALARAAAARGSIGLCFIDLDRFKGVNDSRGHAAGDALLIDVADQIRKGTRASDLAARVGGDEFVVLLDPVDGPGQALNAAARLRNLILTVDQGECAVPVGASIGLAISQPGDTAATLVSRADAALYRAKARRDSSIELALGDGFVAATSL